MILSNVENVPRRLFLKNIIIIFVMLILKELKKLELIIILMEKKMKIMIRFLSLKVWMA